MVPESPSNPSSHEWSLNHYMNSGHMPVSEPSLMGLTSDVQAAISHLFLLHLWLEILPTCLESCLNHIGKVGREKLMAQNCGTMPTSRK